MNFQNKYGVKVEFSWDEPIEREGQGAHGTAGEGEPEGDGTGEGGARELVSQLMAGRGAGQEEEGLYNVNLR